MKAARGQDCVNWGTATLPCPCENSTGPDAVVPFPSAACAPPPCCFAVPLHAVYSATHVLASRVGFVVAGTVHARRRGIAPSWSTLASLWHESEMLEFGLEVRDGRHAPSQPSIVEPHAAVDGDRCGGCVFWSTSADHSCLCHTCSHADVRNDLRLFSAALLTTCGCVPSASEVLPSAATAPPSIVSVSRTRDAHTHTRTHLRTLTLHSHHREPTLFPSLSSVRSAVDEPSTEHPLLSLYDQLRSDDGVAPVAASVSPRSSGAHVTSPSHHPHHSDDYHVQAHRPTHASLAHHSSHGHGQSHSHGHGHGHSGGGRHGHVSASASKLDPGLSKLTLDVRELRDVPVSELLLSFPATYIRMKPLDLARLLVLGSASISVLVHMCVSHDSVGKGADSWGGTLGEGVSGKTITASVASGAGPR